MEGDHLEDPGVDGRIIMDLQEVGCGGMDWIELAPEKGQVAGTCDCGKEPSGSIKCGEFIDQMRNFSFSRTLLH